jgi:hypothetical protein
MHRLMRWSSCIYLSCVLPMSFDESLEQLQKLFEAMTGLLYDPALG